MTSLELVRVRLAEAVETHKERSPETQRRLLADLLAIALAASKKSPSTV